ncbi:hypothetical protein BS78_09G107500, partial [Paspalum vaginatum]
MDFIEGLPKSEGYNAILVVVDRFTKFAHFIAIKHPYTAQGIARLILDNVVRLHELWYNFSYHSAIHSSPFRALYGQESNLVAETAISSSTVESVNAILTDRAAHLQQLKLHLATAQNRMKQYSDKAHTDLQFQVGEQVLLKLQPYAQSSLVNWPFPKLAFKYFGPYKVLEKVGAVAYKFDLPAISHIHPIFHISQLKPCTPDYSPIFSELPSIPVRDAPSVEPQAFLERRLVKRGNIAVPQVRIQWSSLPSTATTWENYNVVRARFP